MTQKSRDALQNGRFVKGIIGASVTDEKEIKISTGIYTQADYHGIDVRAGKNEIKAAVSGKNRALAQMNKTHGPLIIGSITPSGDVHSLKANIDKDRCINCGICKDSCPNDAIYEDKGTVMLNEPRCRGCGRCEDVCQNNAINLKPMDTVSIQESVNNCINAGADGIEIHMSGFSEKEVDEVMDEIKEFVPSDYFPSFCIGSMASSPKEISSVTRCIEKKRKGLQTVIQADGATMGGRPGSFQGLATAEQVINALGYGSEIYVIVSGSVTELTWHQIEASGLEVAGIGVGIRARELIKDALAVSDFDNNNEIIEEAVRRAMVLHRPASHENNTGKVVKSYSMGPALKRALSGGKENAVYNTL